MALGDTGNLVFASGQLCTTSGSFTLTVGGTFPWGGTALALVKNVVALPVRKWVPLRDEPIGGSHIPLDGIDLGEAWVVRGSFRTFDPDVVKNVFASTAAGSSTGLTGIQFPNANTYRTGTLASSRAGKFMFSPDDVENQRFLYLYNAFPIVPEGGELPYQRGEEWVVPFELIALPDGSNNSVASHLLQDLASVIY